MNLRSQFKATMLVSLIAGVTACQTTPPERMVDKSKTRNLTLELFSAISGNETMAVHHPAGMNEVTMNKIIWNNPETKEAIPAYSRERIHSGNGRKIVQTFAMRTDKQAIGRVHDSRFGALPLGGAKFPLGEWYQGETRSFDVGGKKMTLTITNIQGNDDELEFVWQAYSFECWKYKYKPKLGMTNANKC